MHFLSVKPLLKFGAGGVWGNGSIRKLRKYIVGYSDLARCQRETLRSSGSALAVSRRGKLITVLPPASGWNKPAINSNDEWNMYWVLPCSLPQGASFTVP